MTAFPTKDGLQDHLKYKHEPPMGQNMKMMQKKKHPMTTSMLPTLEESSTPNADQKASQSTEGPLLVPTRPVRAVNNTSGRVCVRARATLDSEFTPCFLQDCFSISVLHLLAQTELAEILSSTQEKDENHDSDCKLACCLLANFFKAYRNGSKLLLDPISIMSNYAAFGLEGQSVHEVDCGDFLRSALFKVIVSINVSFVVLLPSRNSELEPDSSTVVLENL